STPYSANASVFVQSFANGHSYMLYGKHIGVWTYLRYPRAKIANGIRFQTETLPTKATKNRQVIPAGFIMLVTNRLRQDRRAADRLDATPAPDGYRHAHTLARSCLHRSQYPRPYVQSQDRPLPPSC